MCEVTAIYLYVFSYDLNMCEVIAIFVRESKLGLHAYYNMYVLVFNLIRFIDVD